MILWLVKNLMFLDSFSCLWWAQQTIQRVTYIFVNFIVILNNYTLIFFPLSILLVKNNRVLFKNIFQTMLGSSNLKSLI